MMSRRVYSDVMKIVEFHHQGHLDSFVYDQFLRMNRARYLMDLYTFQVNGARVGDGAMDDTFVPFGLRHEQTLRSLCFADDNFVPGVVSDPRKRIRLIDPELTAGPTSVYDVAIRVNRAYDIAYDALEREDASRLWFCLRSYGVLMIEEGFVIPEVCRRWCDIKQEYVVVPMGACAVVLRSMQHHRVAYAAWAAKVRE